MEGHRLASLKPLIVILASPTRLPLWISVDGESQSRPMITLLLTFHVNAQVTTTGTGTIKFTLTDGNSVAQGDSSISITSDIDGTCDRLPFLQLCNDRGICRRGYEWEGRSESHMTWIFKSLPLVSFLCPLLYPQERQHKGRIRSLPFGLGRLSE